MKDLSKTSMSGSDIMNKFFKSKLSFVELFSLFFMLEFSYVAPITPFILLVYLNFFDDFIIEYIKHEAINAGVIAGLLLMLVIRLIFAYIHCRIHGCLITSIAKKIGLKNIVFANTETKSYFQWEIIIQVICSILLTAWFLKLYSSIMDTIYALTILPIFLLFTAVIFIIRMSAASALSCLKGKSFLSALNTLIAKSPVKMLGFSFAITLTKALTYIPALLIMYFTLFSYGDTNDKYIAIISVIVYIITTIIGGTFMTCNSLAFAYNQLHSDEAFRDECDCP